MGISIKEINIDIEISFDTNLVSSLAKSEKFRRLDATGDTIISINALFI